MLLVFRSFQPLPGKGWYESGSSSSTSPASLRALCSWAIANRSFDFHYLTWTRHRSTASNETRILCSRLNRIQYFRNEPTSVVADTTGNTSPKPMLCPERPSLYKTWDEKQARGGRDLSKLALLYQISRSKSSYLCNSTSFSRKT